MLRTVSFGGYDKKSVIALTDALNTAIFNMEEDMKSLDYNKIIDEIQACKVTKTFFGGFDRSDVKVYVNELIQKIKYYYSNYYGNEGPFAEFQIDLE